MFGVLQELGKRGRMTATGGELGGHRDRDQHCVFVYSWPLSSTDRVGHVPKTGISQGTKSRKEKESRYELRKGTKHGPSTRRGFKHKAVEQQHPWKGRAGSLWGNAGTSSLPMQRWSRESKCSLPGSERCRHEERSTSPIHTAAAGSDIKGM